jgi:hypothetical protein
MMDEASSNQVCGDVEGSVDLDIEVASPAIRRLIEEVRAEAFDVPRSYNRTFNRHNR